MTWTNRARLDPAGAPARRIVVDDSGLQVVDPTGPAANPIARLNWADVSRVTAYKRDLFAYDLVCLLIELADGQSVELDEQLCGWERLLEVLPSALPGALDRDRLLDAVVLPAFATNLTVVYVRDSRHTV